MQISMTTAAEHLKDLKEGFKDYTGYSHASYQIIKSLEKLGLSVGIRNGSAPIGISMGFPLDYDFAPGQYRIGYTAWESTKLQPGWFEKMHACHEVWATSSWTARVFQRQLGIEDIHVYPHGIDHSWGPVHRERKDIFRFLHIGEPQIRKNGQLVVDTFIELFGRDPNYQLIMKCSDMNTTRVYMDDGSILGSPDAHYQNIKLITEPLEHSQLVRLYHLSNALIYPSAGEGFGFIPLQALATGMPTISTWQWAEYKKFITIPLKSSLNETIHEQLHPGLTYDIDKEFLKQSMIEIVENYKKYQQETLLNAKHVHEEFDWITVTKPTAKRLKNILKNRGL